MKIDKNNSSGNKVDLLFEYREGLALNEHERIELIEKALEVSKKRSEILEKLKNAILKNNVEDIKRYAKMICGLIEPE